MSEDMEKIQTFENMSEDEKYKIISEAMDEEKHKIISEAMDEEKQKDFYEKLTAKIRKYVSEHPNSKYVNYILLAPDFFHLLCRLLGDERVPLKNKLYIAGAILYFFSPLDLITDLIPGVGQVDDVIIAIYVINSLLNSVDEEVIKELWAGEGNIIEQLKQLLNMADGVVGKGVLSKIKAFFVK